MHRFDFSEMRGNIPQDIAELVSHIREIRALDGIRETRYAREFSKVQEIAKLKSVKYSNEIEGIATSDERLADIVLAAGIALMAVTGLFGYETAVPSVASVEYAEVDG